MESDTKMGSGSVSIVDINTVRRPGRNQAIVGRDRLQDQPRRRSLSSDTGPGGDTHWIVVTPRGLDLEALLDYEIRSSSRNRHFVTVVVMTTGDGASDFRDLLGDTIRESDGFFLSGKEAVIVMGETDQPGALRAVMRFKEKTDDRCDIRYGISSYPVDGQSGAELLDQARGRLGRAGAMKRGAVVASG
jgi:hypothetical protein